MKTKIIFALAVIVLLVVITSCHVKKSHNPSPPGPVKNLHFE